MDVHMPEMDGVEATRRIRALPAPAAAIPIVALTADAMTGDRERYLHAGMTDYLSKPISRERLEAVLAAAVSMGEADDPRPAAAG